MIIVPRRRLRNCSAALLAAAAVLPVAGFAQTSSPQIPNQPSRNDIIRRFLPSQAEQAKMAAAKAAALSPGRPQPAEALSFMSFSHKDQKPATDPSLTKELVP
jgi:hypothetical protein